MIFLINFFYKNLVCGECILTNNFFYKKIDLIICFTNNYYCYKLTLTNDNYQCITIIDRF